MKQLQNTDLEKLSHNFQVKFALFCAKQVIGLVKSKNRQICENAILITEKWLEGKATAEECKTAAYAAANAAADAAYAAAYAAANAAAYAADAADAAANAAAYAAANAAADAANAAYAAADAANASLNKEQSIKEQWDYYNELLFFDKNFEEIVLK